MEDAFHSDEGAEQKVNLPSSQLIDADLKEGMDLNSLLRAKNIEKQKSFDIVAERINKMKRDRDAKVYSEDEQNMELKTFNSQFESK